MSEILTVIRDFTVYGNSDDAQAPYGLDLPKISVQFVGVSPAMAFDVHNQPKLARDKERQLRKIETAVRTQFEDAIGNMGGNDLAANLQTMQRLITAFKEQLETDFLVKDQLELESLTTNGEWLTYWDENASLVKAKELQQDNLPQDF